MKGMRHGEYVAIVEYDDETEGFTGRVANIPEVVTFWGASAPELKEEFATSINTYEEVCNERGIVPSKPFGGQVPLRMGVDLHRRVALAASLEGKSVNSWVASVLEREVDDLEV